MMRVSTWAILGLLIAAVSPAFAQDVIVVPPVTAYYPPAPVYVSPPTVSYYAGPAPVVSYSMPATTVYYPPVSGPYVTTYRYGLFGLRTATTTSYYPPVVAPAYPVYRPRVAYYVYP